MTLDLFLKDNNCYITEGYIEQVPEQVQILKDLVNNNKIKNILQVGFNAGHSSCLFLENNKQCNVVSFDIGTHDYVHIGKQYIDKTYPNRHELIRFYSKIAVPIYINTNKDIKFDLIFIDGGCSKSKIFTRGVYWELIRGVVWGGVSNSIFSKNN